jgi:hypothetical protein
MRIGELETFKGEFNWAEAAAQRLEEIASFIRKHPAVAEPMEETADTVTRAEPLMDELNYFSCNLDESGAELFEDDDLDDEDDDLPDRPQAPRLPTEGCRAVLLWCDSRAVSVTWGEPSHLPTTGAYLSCPARPALPLRGLEARRAIRRKRSGHAEEQLPSTQTHHQMGRHHLLSWLLLVSSLCPAGPCGAYARCAR